MSNNITELCNQVLDLANICTDLCAKTLKVCLDQAVEPSYNNPFAACQEFTQNCNYVCNNVTTICLPSNYPLNRKYSNSQFDGMIAALFIEGLLALVGLDLWLMQHKRRFEKNEPQVNLIIGQIIGLALGLYFTFLIQNSLAVPPVKKFTQNNPADLDVSNMMIAASAMPAIAASTGVCGVIFDLGIPLIKKPVLNAYENFKNRSRGRVENIHEFELEEDPSISNPAPSAANRY